MSPLVEQIVQRLELLPERILEQVLEIVRFLEISALPHAVDTASQQQQEPDVDRLTKLKKSGSVWIVRASSSPTEINWDDCILDARQERIEKFMQW